MEKLKTMKDLEIFDLNPKDKLYEYEQGKQFTKSWVKQLAVEWIKELKIEQKKSGIDCDLLNKKQDEDGWWQCKDCKFLCDIEDNYYSHCQKYILLQQQIDWIINFFNLNEIDLQ